jgi:hypothetical protein
LALRGLELGKSRRLRESEVERLRRASDEQGPRRTRGG